ncbi:MAG: 3D domain-containing protein [Planctomycetota bacterium]|jgi:3D (Asp-Asp-Asp) domain-containing protein|nr:3D domain-containing protein [Planctomycetota bacterium]
MYWRLWIFFLSATAAFCFMLLTATTDYGAKAAPPRLASAILDNSAETEPIPASIPSATFRSFIPPTLNPVRLFVPENADPVRERRLAQQAESANRGKPANRKRVKWDADGWHREEVAMVTAYCPCARCCGLSSPGVTSIGKNAWLPGLAADPAYLDYGTRIFVPGYGLSVMDDTGGAMRRHWRRNGILHIDIRMTYHHEAKRWGRQYLRVKIYEE